MNTLQRPKLYQLIIDIKYFDLDTFEEFPSIELNKHDKWYRREYNRYGFVVYQEYSNGKWERAEYNTRGYQTYFEDSEGKIVNKKDQYAFN